MIAKLYNVMTVNDRTGRTVNMLASPVTHREACTILAKLSPLPQFPHVRRMLVESEALSIPL